MKIGWHVPLLFLLYDNSGSMTGTEINKPLNALITKWHDQPALISVAHYGSSSHDGDWGYDYQLKPSVKAQLIKNYSPYTSCEGPAIVLSKVVEEIKGVISKYPISNILVGIFTDGNDDTCDSRDCANAKRKIEQCKDLRWKFMVVFPVGAEAPHSAIMHYGLDDSDILQLKF